MARFAQQTKAAHRRRCGCGRWRDWRAKRCSTCHIILKLEPKLSTASDMEWQEFSAWLAGEGHARFSADGKRSDITISNIDTEIMGWLHKTFGGRIKFRHTPNRSPIYEWALTGILNLRYVFTMLIPITHHGKRHLYKRLLDDINTHLAPRGL